MVVFLYWNSSDQWNCKPWSCLNLNSEATKSLLLNMIEAPNLREFTVKKQWDRTTQMDSSLSQTKINQPNVEMTPRPIYIHSHKHIYHISYIIYIYIMCIFLCNSCSATMMMLWPAGIDRIQIEITSKSAVLCKRCRRHLSRDPLG